MTYSKNKYSDTQFYWFKDRFYLHFDKPLTLPIKKNDDELSLIRKKTQNIHLLESNFSKLFGTDISKYHSDHNTSKINKHSFLPFLRFSVTTYKTVRTNKTWADARSKKNREISYASHKDSFIYSYFSKILSDKYETLLKHKNITTNIIAFRKLSFSDENGNQKGKSNINFSKDAFDLIEKKGNCTCLCFDLEKFFDTLDHSYLKSAWKTVLGTRTLPKDHFAIYKSITKYSYINVEELLPQLGITKTMFKLKQNKTNNIYSGRMNVLCAPETLRNTISKQNLIKVNRINGIPQGSPLSGILSNIYMLNFDEAIIKYLKIHNATYWRYCDDILIIIPNNQHYEAHKKRDEEIKEYLSNYIETELKLNIQNKKTEIIIFEKDQSGNININEAESTKKYLQYLGLTFNGKKTLIRSSSIHRFYRKLKKAKRISVKSMDKNKSHTLYRKKLFKRYSHFGEINFISYTYRVANEFNKNNIKRQVRKHMEFLKK